MADIQEQIGERARAAAGYSRCPQHGDTEGDHFCTYGAFKAEPVLAEVGDVITEGPIPANVVEVKDCEGDTYVLNAVNHWHTPAFADPSSCGLDKYCSSNPLEFAPLTVTKVRPEPAAEPQPDVLDLVRQYGDQMFEAGSTSEARYGESASLLLDRITAEVERRRSTVLDAGMLVDRYIDQRDKARAEVETQAGNFLAASNKLIIERDDARRARDFLAEQVVAPTREALDAVGATNQLKMVDRVLLLASQRDEALAEVERLKAKVREETELQDEYADWATRLANAAVERLNLPVTEEAHTELWEFALDGLKAPAPAAPGRTEQARDDAGVPLWQHDCGLVAELWEHPGPFACESCANPSGPWRPLLVAAPQQDGPLVLSLPEVPDGTVALVGDVYRYRFLDNGNGERYWVSPDLGPLPLGHVLDFEGSVTVEMAPPREPRTWPKLDDAPADLRVVRGASGRVYRPHDGGPDARWFYVDAVHGRMGFESFAEIQYQDGPLTEVFE